METDTERWFKKEGEKALKEIGIKRGHTILDFRKDIILVLEFIK